MNGLLLTTQSESKDIKFNIKKLLNTKDELDQMETDFFQKTLEDILKESPDEKNKTFLISKLLDISKDSLKEKKITSSFSNEEMIKDQTLKVTLQELTTLVSILKNDTDKNIDLSTTNDGLKTIISNSNALKEFKNAKNIDDLLKIAQKHGIEIKNFEFFSTEKALDSSAKEIIKKIKSEDIFNLINKQTDPITQKQNQNSDPLHSIFKREKEQKSPKKILQNILNSNSMNDSKKIETTDNKQFQNDTIEKTQRQTKEKQPYVKNDEIITSIQKDRKTKHPKQSLKTDQIQSTNTFNSLKSLKSNHKERYSDINHKSINSQTENELKQSRQNLQSTTINRDHTKKIEATVQKDHTINPNHDIRITSVKDKPKNLNKHINSQNEYIINHNHIKRIPTTMQKKLNDSQNERISSINHHLSANSIKDEPTLPKNNIKTAQINSNNSENIEFTNKIFPTISENQQTQKKALNRHFEQIERLFSKEEKTLSDNLRPKTLLQNQSESQSTILKEKEETAITSSKREKQAFSSIFIDTKINKQSGSGFLESKTIQNYISKQTVQNAISLDKIDIKEKSESEFQKSENSEPVVSEKHEISTQQKQHPPHIQKNEHHQLKKTFNTFAQDFREKVENYKPPLMKIKMQLNPGNLGEVDVTLINRGNNLQVNINSNPNTIAIFAQNQTEFKNSLINMGFTSLQMNFGENKDNQRGQNHKENGKNTKFFEDDHIETDGFEMIIPQYI